MLFRRHNNLIELLRADKLKHNHFMTFQLISGNSQTIRTQTFQTICFIQKSIRFADKFNKPPEQSSFL